MSNSRFKFIHQLFNDIIGIKIYVYFHKQRKHILINTFDFCHSKKYNKNNKTNNANLESEVWFPITYSHIRQNNMDILKQLDGFLTVNNSFKMNNKFIFRYNIIPGFGIYTFTICCLFHFIYKPLKAIWKPISKALMIYFIYLLFGFLLITICLYLHFVFLTIKLPFQFLIQLYYHCDTSLIVFRYHLHITLTLMYIGGILLILFLSFRKTFYLIYSQIHFYCYIRKDLYYKIPCGLASHIVNTYNNSIQRNVILENSFLGKDLTTIVLKYLPKLCINQNEMKQLKMQWHQSIGNI